MTLTAFTVMLLSAALLSAASETVTVCEDASHFTSSESLPIDEGGRLIEPWLLIHQDSPEISSVGAQEALAAKIIPRRLGLIGGELKRQLPRVGCLEKGLMPEFLAEDGLFASTEEINLVEWVDQNCQAIEIGFVNLYQEDVHFKNGADVGVIKAGGINDTVQFYRHWSFSKMKLGSTFQVFPPDSEEPILTDVVTHTRPYILRPPPLEDPASAAVDPDASRPIEGLTAAPDDLEEKIEFTRSNELLRRAQVKRTFNARGFEVVPIPRATWALMSRYYHNNKENFAAEEWQRNAERIFVNHWESPTHIIPVSKSMKLKWEQGLMPVVSEWAGGIELEPTATYGMRIYRNGSWLLKHVDKQETHVLSLVVNVAQEDLAEPWALSIDSHDGVTHDVFIKPGEMILYESARCLHGRPKPLNGKGFINVFAHFRPKGDPNWYKVLEGHDGSPKSAMPVPDPCEEATVKPKGCPSKLTITNKANGPIDILWLSPTGERAMVEPGVPAGDSRVVSGFVGHVMVTVLSPLDAAAAAAAAATAADDDDEEEEDEDDEEEEEDDDDDDDDEEEAGLSTCEQTFTIGGTHEAVEACGNKGAQDLAKRRERWETDALLKMRGFKQMIPVKFRNICNRTVHLFFCAGRSGILQAVIAPGKDAALNAHPQQKFNFGEVGTEARDGCTDATSLKSVKVSEEEYMYVVDDGSSDDEALITRHTAEVDAAAEYRARTGRHWMSYWPRKPCHTHMRVAEVDETITVPLDEDMWKVRHNDDNGEAALDKDKELKMKALSVSPRVFQIDNFLSTFETEGLITMGASRMARSTSGANKVDDTRTSQNTWINRDSSDLTKRIYRRAAAVLGVEKEYLNTEVAEPLQLVYYDVNQRYDAHYDWGVAFNATRYATLLLYLNTPTLGGETAFPKGMMKVKPVKGRAVLFYNLLPDGNADMASFHAALPVQEGEKWLANLWVWDDKRRFGDGHA